jgi:hypothetical protein
VIERIFNDARIVAVNVHRQPEGGFMVHVRRQDEGFVCAQRVHDTVDLAIAEYLPKKIDLGDIL